MKWKFALHLPQKTSKLPLNQFLILERRNMRRNQRHVANRWHFNSPAFHLSTNTYYFQGREPPLPIKGVEGINDFIIYLSL